MTLDALLAELAILPDGWQDSRVGRITATRDSPLLFSYIYLRHTLKAQTGVVSFSSVHLEWYAKATEWMTPGASRDIYVAPRSLGKSSTWFLLVPMWAAAHQHIGFVSAFSDNATQAEEHLRSFRHELQVNALLRNDYPHLSDFKVDNVGMLQTTGGFVFSAKGIDAGTLGQKVGDQRPGVIVLDDVEPGVNYSAYQVGKRLETVTDVILPLNDQAKVVMTGTAVSYGSLIHQAVLHEVDPATWIKDENFTVHYSQPFDDAGESIWPERWSTEYLRSIEHTRSFAKSFLSLPVTLDGEYWLPEDFVYGELSTVSRRILVVDVAVTTSKRSDESALAVMSYSAHTRMACVDHVQGVRLKGEPLRELCLRLLGQFPDCVHVVWERNQGGTMLPASVLHDFPIEVKTVHNSEPKPVRIERSLSYYRRGVVTHARSFPAAEAQMMEFPHGLHDDLADVVSIGLDHFARASQPTKKGSLSVAIR